MTGYFTCLKCGHKFEHYWTGGDPNKPLSSAATNCKSCGHMYVKLNKTN